MLLLDCGGIPGFEFTALKMLGEAEAKLRDGGSRAVAGRAQRRSAGTVRASPLGETLGRERMFFTVEGAVDAYVERHPQLGDSPAAAGPS